MDSSTTIGFDFDDSNPDTVIGPYRLVRQMGEGGMGVVYHAQQSGPIRRDVALKVIKPGMDTKQVIARFETERQALAVMDHPNIAHVFDAGTTSNGRPYFVMELVDGVPITHFCDSKRLSIRERIELFVPVCQAIQHAHQKGIIHRDIKPSNILIAEREGRPALKPENTFLAESPEEKKQTVKVLDFGIAKFVTAPKQDESTSITKQTDVSVLVGTPAYMSPEQLLGANANASWDLWALAVLAYECLAGVLPFPSSSGDWRRNILSGSFTPLRQHVTEAQFSCRSSLKTVFLLIQCTVQCQRPIFRKDSKLNTRLEPMDIFT